MDLLVVLKKYPVKSMNELAQILGISPNTVKTRLNKMKDVGILRKNDIIRDPLLGERKICETVSQVNPYSIGLVRVYFIIKEINGFSNYTLICNFIDKQPYAVHRSLMMGQGFNIISEFHIPPNGVEHLETFINYIKSQKLFKEYIMIEPTETHFCKNDISQFNYMTSQWEVDLYKNQEKMASIEAIFHNYRNNIKDDLPKLPEISKKKLKEIDMRLLRELSINGKPSINYIASLYNKENTSISRKIQKIRNLFISHYNIMYNKSIFHLGSEFFIYGKMDRAGRYALKKLITDNILPFNSKYSEDTRFFTLRIEGPAFFVNDLVRLLSPNATQINQLTVHKKTNIRYFFYFKNYNFDTRKWKVSEEYIIHEPLRT